jgi:hypothetical protein
MYGPGLSLNIWVNTLCNPTFVAQNMTDGGSMIAANYVYGVAKSDGLTLGVVSPGLYIQQLSGQKEVKFEWFKYSWIGSSEKTDRGFYIRADRKFMLRRNHMLRGEDYQSLRQWFILKMPDGTIEMFIDRKRTSFDFYILSIP